MKFGGPCRPGWVFLHLADGLATPTKHARPGRSVLDPRDKDIQSTAEDLLEIFTDSDWAGNRRTRKSVSVAHFYLNGVLLHTLTRSQSGQLRFRHGFDRVRGHDNRCIVEFITGRKCSSWNSDAIHKERNGIRTPQARCWQSTPHLMWITVVARTCEG